MALSTARKFQKLCTNNAILYTAVRNHWNKDYKPGDFPMTEEQRLAAAKKYQLHPSDYKPFPNDGSGFGDYPDVVVESGDSRDPFYPWDNPELKRNFNEPMHTEFDLYGEDRYDVSYKHRLPVIVQVGQFCLAVFGCFGIYLYLNRMKQFAGLKPKQYPNTGTKHYEF